MTGKPQRALRQRWFQGGLCVLALVGLVAIGSQVFGYSVAWVSLALGAGAMVISLFVFRGLWLNAPPSRDKNSDD